MMKFKKVFVALAVFGILISIFMFCSKHSEGVLENKEESYSYQELENLPYEFPLQDEFDSDGNLTVADFMRQPDSYTKLKRFNEKLHSDFKYIEMISQPVEVIGKFDLPLDFVNGYMESGKTVDLSNQPMYINGESTYITPLNAVQVDYNAYNYYNFLIKEGRGFKETDFKYSEICPIILGSNYTKFYSVGDTLEFYYLGKKTEAAIIGFLKDDFLVSNEETNLNNYIVMPITCEINIDQLHDSEYLYKDEYDDPDKFYLTFLYMQKNNGIFLCKHKEEYDSLKDRIKRISGEIGVAYSVKNFY